MKISASLFLLVSAAMTGQLHAQSQIGGGTCTNSLLSGTYFYLLSGSIVASGQPVPYVELGKLVSDGSGNVSGQSKASLGGVFSSYTLAGTYSVQSNCSGNISLTVNSSGTSNLTFQLSNGGKQITVAASSPGAVVVGRAYPVSQSSANLACSNASFSGTYAYLLTGFVNAGASTLLYADDGQATADGSGALSAVSTANLGGSIAPATGSGTYSVASDCSGTARVSNANGTLNYLLAVVQDGQALLFMGADAGYVISGTAQPQFTAPQQSIVNSASFLPGRLSAGSLFSVFGNALSQQTASAQSLPLPRTLGGTQVLVNGSPAPLFYVSPGQINVQMPFEVQPGTPVSIAVTSGSVKSNIASVVLQPAAPGIFLYGNNRAIVQNPDGSLVSSASPAHPGDILVGYLTGGGPVNAAGTLQTGAASPNGASQVTSNYSITMGGQNAVVMYLGLTPTLVGVYQVNFKVPVIASGDYSIVVNVNGVASNGPNITVAD